MYIKNLKHKHYKKNMLQIHKNCTSKHWKETNSMTRIPLANFVAANYGPFMKNVKGDVVEIRGRTLFIIKNN